MKNKKHIHFGGIGGCGISALAQIAMSRGFKVSGSDVAQSVYSQKLQKVGVTIHPKHDKENVVGSDLIVNSAAIEESNPEVQEAKRRNIPVLKHAQFLGQLMKDKYAICVAGTHGKTTTDAMIGLMLTEAGLDPTIEIGGTVRELDGNVRIGNGKYFVAEACEFDRSFLSLFPKIGIVLNIEEDHPDYYPNVETLKKAFTDFMNLVPQDGFIVIDVEKNTAKEVLKSVTSKAQKITIGTDKSADWWAENIDLKPGQTTFQAMHQGRNIGKFTLLIPGRHNIQNALAVLAVAEILKVDFEIAQRVFGKFKGVDRRFEIIHQNDTEIVLDYAHHPTQIGATIDAAKQQGYNRVLVAFQPHTYSRTKYLWNEFIHAFKGADAVFISDTYIPAGRHEIELPEFSSEKLAKEIQKLQPGVLYTGSLAQTTEKLKSEIREKDLVLILGAGDIYKIADKL